LPHYALLLKQINSRCASAKARNFPLPRFSLPLLHNSATLIERSSFVVLFRLLLQLFFTNFSLDVCLLLLLPAIFSVFVFFFRGFSQFAMRQLMWSEPWAMICEKGKQQGTMNSQANDDYVDENYNDHDNNGRTLYIQLNK